jgi:RNA polymerase sigma factor (sigma-70 family)
MDHRSGHSLLPPPRSLGSGTAGPTELPGAEAALTRLALAARAGDGPARDALYRALTPNLDRMIRTVDRLTWAGDCPRRNGRPWAQEDLRQESYVIFCDLLSAWSSEGPFTPYLCAYFPWRLRNAWRRLRPDRPRGAMVPGGRSPLEIDPTAVAEEARVLLEALAESLPAEERAILLAHVRDGVSLAELGRQLGLRPPQIGRRWRAITRWLRGELELPAGGRFSPSPRHERDRGRGAGRRGGA